MDGFYLALVAAGAALFFLSARHGRPITGALLLGWWFIAGALGSAVALFASLSVEKFSPSDIGEVSQRIVAFSWFEVLRHVLLGGAVVCISLYFAEQRDSKTSGKLRRIDPAPPRSPDEIEITE